MSGTHSRVDRLDREILLVVCSAAIASATLEAIGAYSSVAAGGLVTLAVGLGVTLLRRRVDSPALHPAAVATRRGIGPIDPEPARARTDRSTA